MKSAGGRRAETFDVEQAIKTMRARRLRKANKKNEPESYRARKARELREECQLAARDSIAGNIRSVREQLNDISGGVAHSCCFIVTEEWFKGKMNPLGNRGIDNVHIHFPLYCTSYGPIKADHVGPCGICKEMIEMNYYETCMRFHKHTKHFEESIERFRKWKLCDTCQTSEVGEGRCNKCYEIAKAREIEEGCCSPSYASPKRDAEEMEQVEEKPSPKWRKQ
jgi:hypothetical protein